MGKVIVVICAGYIKKEYRVPLNQAIQSHV
jgi:hypothetical protein